MICIREAIERTELGSAGNERKMRMTGKNHGGGSGMQFRDSRLRVALPSVFVMGTGPDIRDEERSKTRNALTGIMSYATVHNTV